MGHFAGQASLRAGTDDLREPGQDSRVAHTVAREHFDRQEQARNDTIDQNAKPAQNDDITHQMLGLAWTDLDGGKMRRVGVEPTTR